MLGSPGPAPQFAFCPSFICTPSSPPSNSWISILIVAAPGQSSISVWRTRTRHVPSKQLLVRLTCRATVSRHGRGQLRRDQAVREFLVGYVERILRDTEQVAQLNDEPSQVETKDGNIRVAMNPMSSTFQTWF